MNDEAMLTGESIPQMKESLRTRAMESMTSQSIEESNEDATVVDGGEGASMRVDGSIETTWKHYMMFSGTSLLMHSERRVDIEGSSSSCSSSSDSIPSAQDKGCLVEVVRTG